MPLYAFILRRLLLAIPTIFAVSVIGFLLMRFDFTIGPYDIPPNSLLNPGNKAHRVYLHIENPIDPLANLRANPQISAEMLKKEERRLGLDKPLPEQYWLWLTNLLHFDLQALKVGEWSKFFQPDLGKTQAGEEVSWLILDRAKNTVLLNICTILITWLVAIPLGVFAAVRWRSIVDRLLTAISAMGMAMPSFVMAILLGMFVVKTGWLPFGGIRSPNYEDLSPWEQGLDVASHLILPVIVLSIGSISSLQRQMRGNLLDILGAEYVRTARAKGLAEHIVLYKHAVRNAMNPLITMLGYEFASLLSGALLVETVLGFPGIGQLMFTAAIQADTNLVMANLIMSAFLLVLGNLLADILLKVADPRVELQ